MKEGVRHASRRRREGGKRLSGREHCEKEVGSQGERGQMEGKEKQVAQVATRERKEEGGGGTGLNCDIGTRG